MIKNLSGLGHVTVNGGQATYPYVSPGANGAGMVRYNSNMQQFEINDGNSWLSIAGAYPSIGLSPAAESAINWVIAKMAEEQRMLELAKKYPAVKDLQERLDMVLALVIEEENGTR
jgi:hypothetical protein